MNELMQDPLFYYAVPFAIFLGLVWWKGRKPLLAWLDTEISKIRHELDQAQQLRAEAEAMLADGKAKQAAALADAEAIIRQAKGEAERMKAQTDIDLKNHLALHETLIAERIRIAESEAMDMVRMAAIDAAMKLARETLAVQIDEATAAKLVDQALAEMPNLTAAKAKAA